MIVAIERSKFIYLYKYNEIGIDTNQVIDLSGEIIIDLYQQNDSKIVEDFNRILPIFEQDHEIILLEVERRDIIIGSKLGLRFKAVTSIYPLTTIGSQLLQGKLNDDFIINKPIFEDIVETVKIIRTLSNRKMAAMNLLSFFSLSDTNTIIDPVQKSLERIISKKDLINSSKTYLDYLIEYNKTPNNIPDGNVEFLCKIGIIVLNYLKIDEGNFYKGPFYKSSLAFRDLINGTSIFNSYSTFISINDRDLQLSLDSLKSKIDIDIFNIDIFKASYFFLAYKAFLNKNDKNLLLLKREIEQLIFDDEKTATLVLILIGYAFSFESLYDSLHRLNNSPLIKNTLRQFPKEESSILQNGQKDKEKVPNAPNKVLEEEKDTENTSVPIVVFDNFNDEKKNLTLFADEENVTEKDVGTDNEEITRSTTELKVWLKSQKPSKSAAAEWERFIDKSLIYGHHSLTEILNKIKVEKLEGKLTKKMLKELELFYL